MSNEKGEAMDELKGFSKKTGFSVPENYFDDLESKVIQDIKTPKVSLYAQLKPYLMIAASFVLIFTVWRFLLFSNLAQKNKTNVNDYSYVDIQLDDIDENTIIMAFSEDKQVSDNDIISYLCEEDFSTSFLLDN